MSLPEPLASTMADYSAYAQRQERITASLLSALKECVEWVDPQRQGASLVLKISRDAIADAEGVRYVNSHAALVDALTRSQVALSAVLEIAERQDQPADMLASLRSVVHRNDLALRDANGLPGTTRTDADVEDDKRAITEGADL